MNVNNSNFTVSAIKKEEKGDGIVVRIFNGMKNEDAKEVLTSIKMSMMLIVQCSTKSMIILASLK